MENLVKKKLDSLIQELTNKGYRKGKPAEAFCDLEIKLENGPYPISIREINVPDTKLMEDVYNLLVKTFKTVEVDPHDHFLACAEGKTIKGGDSLVRYRITVATHDNIIQAAYVWGLTPLVNKKNEQTDQLLFSGFYAVTIPELRQKGMNRELYLSALLRAREEASRLKKEISVIVGDVVQDAQRSWNRLGRKKLFIQSESNVLEFPYLQPSLLFDEHSGMPHDDQEGAVSEHLMIHLMDDDLLTPEFVGSIVRTLYWWSTQQMLPALRTNSSRNTYLSIVQKWQQKCERLLSTSGDLILLTVKQIEEMQASENYIFFKPDKYY